MINQDFYSYDKIKLACMELDKQSCAAIQALHLRFVHNTHLDTDIPTLAHNTYTQIFLYMSMLNCIHILKVKI